MSGNSGAPLRATSIAVIGMAGRFPGATSVERFWANIAQGVESITFFSDEQLLAAGVDAELLTRPDFVKASPILEGVDQFDAAFFKIGRREAELIDPQQRILLELAWEAMEEAGYAPDGFRGLVGVFTGGGGSMSSYAISPFHIYHRLLGQTGSIQATGNDKDYLSTRISYKLDLRGPSLTVQTACSTSLVAVHLACQSLLAGECDMALAGGATVRVPHIMGYFHSGHALLSPDGHCRAFDAAAQGTLFGSGAGLVLLKPLPKAVADGDHIHAVIRGSAVNNDGAAKLSYWATSADGQAAAVAEALAVAEVPPETVGYMEAHGTATTMGDPVEIAGLTKAFRRGTQEKQFCALGSVKSNVGHLEAAAGIASLIKAVLALEHQTLPPSLHFVHPNPAIHFENTPFYVNTERRPWQRGDLPRRAAVNSLGIGGTNAHVILEEAPAATSARPALAADRPLHVLALSAKSPQALGEIAAQYAGYLTEHPEARLPDVCFTAGAGRSHFKHRLALLVESVGEARAKLAAGDRDPPPEGVFRGDADKIQTVAFLFPDVDSASTATGRQLSELLPVFREVLLQCDTAASSLDKPSAPVLDPKAGEGSPSAPSAWAHLACFGLEVALAQLWKSWGVEPTVSLGCGVGQYAAACLAGLFTFDEAVRLVAARASFLSAPPDERQKLAEDFQRTCELVRFKKPRTKLVDHKGQLAGAEIVSAEFWCRQLHEPVQLGAGMVTVQKQGCGIFLEIGSDATLVATGRACRDNPAGLWIASLRQGQSDWPTLLGTVAQLYAQGVRIDWEGFDRGFARRRLVLPTYPFQRQRFWVADDPADARHGSADGEAAAFARRLSEGKIEELVHQLKGATTFSDEEARLLPKLLQAIQALQRKPTPGGHG